MDHGPPPPRPEDEEEGDSEEEPPDFIYLEEPIPPLLSQEDPLRMRLTRQERQWAIDIKNSIEMISDVDCRSDFWYAQLAIICRGDLADVVRRSIGLQDFVEEYSILDTYEDAERAIREFQFHLGSGAYLAFHFSPEEGTYVVVLDPSKLETTEARRNPRMFQRFMRGSYYMQHVLLPDLESIRKGTVGLWECQGVTWAQKHDFQLIAMVGEQFLRYYPFKPKGVKLFHSGVIFNLMFRWIKRVLPPSVWEGLELLHIDNRLDEIYLVPTREVALQRFMDDCVETLRRRYRNEDAFSLNYDTW